MDNLNKTIYGTIEKSEQKEDGTLIVCGYASSGAVDSDGEIITPEAMSKAQTDYMEYANIREMHGSSAAGITTKMDIQEDGRTYIETLIVDPVAVKKCQLGVYKGFSIGGKVTERDVVNKSIIKGIKLIEISLVDRPANPEAKFECFKAEILEVTTPEVEEAPAIVPEIAVEQQAPSLEEVVIEEITQVIDENLTNTDKSVNLINNYINKAGSRNSKSDSERIQKIHDLCLELGAKSPSNMKDIGDTDKSETNDDLQKSLNDNLVKFEELQKSFEKVSKENEELVKRVKELEDLPKPRKASINSVSKSDDIQTEVINTITPILKADGTTDEVATLMKQAFTNKQIVGLK